jgi:aminoglycoside 3-N-acetyltransferase
MSEKVDRKSGIREQDVVAASGRLGIGFGDVLLVHSAMRTVGPIVDGASTIVAGLLEGVGPTGTLVAPTFTFVHEKADNPTIDPENDPSEMGAISERVRKHPDALRSTAYRHSFAAIGKHARAITGVDPRLSPFDLRSSFGAMLALNAQVLLLGVTYTSSTSHHFCEWLANVPYRHTVQRAARIRHPRGVMEEITFIDYQPRPSTDGSYYGRQTTDFNRLGRMLEESGRVAISTLGNAMLRKYALRDLCALAETEAKKDFNIFRSKENETGRSTPLSAGAIVNFYVTDGAGRRGAHELSVVDQAHLRLPPDGSNARAGALGGAGIKTSNPT